MIVTEYLYGETLHQTVKRLRPDGAAEEEVKHVLSQLGSGVKVRKDPVLTLTHLFLFSVPS